MHSKLFKVWYNYIMSTANISDEKVKELELKANDIRESIISMLLFGGRGPRAGPVGMGDIFTLFYFL